MEGRHKPPPASLPFPGESDFYKKWNTPLGRVKYAVIMATGLTAVIGLRYYFADPEKEGKILGFSVVPTREEMLRRHEYLTYGDVTRFNRDIKVDYNTGSVFAQARDLLIISNPKNPFGKNYIREKALRDAMVDESKPNQALDTKQEPDTKKIND